ncbi:MAG: GNAT family protein [Campylobacterales bacterium]
MTSIKTSQVSFDDLNFFFENFDFTQDSAHIRQYIGFIQEASFCYQNIIHKLYNEKEIIGFTALSTTKEVDDISGILVEFLYIKPQYRGKTDEILQTKYSYLLLDYIITTALQIQKLVAINHIYLVPINLKVREMYHKYGFEHIPGSGNNKYEDYMVFNLLDKDPTIL